MAKSAAKEPAESNRGGRKVGSPTRRLVDLSVQAALAGITPIEVMLDNMRFAHEKSYELLERLYEIHATREHAEDEKPLDMFRELLRLKNMAQSCAADAAPYIHPRYSTIQVTDKDNAPVSVGSIIRRIVDPGAGDSKKVRSAPLAS